MTNNFFSSDSIGKCDQYSNQYDPNLTSHPKLIKRRQEEYARMKDTCVSSQTKLEKEVFLRLALKNFQFSGGPLIFFLKGGKLLFYGLMLPIYLFVIGVPKWLMIKGQIADKFLRNFLKIISGRAGEVFNKHSENVIKFFANLSIPVVNLFSKINKQVEKYQKLVGNWLSVTANFLKEKVEKNIYRLKNIFSKVKIKIDFSKLKFLSKKLQEGFTKQISRMPNFNLNFMKFNTDRISRPFIAFNMWFKAKSNLFSKFLGFKKIGANFQNAILNSFNKFRSKTGKIAKKIGEIFLPVSNRVNASFNRLQKVIDHQRENVAKLINAAKKSGKRVKDALKKRADAVKNMVVSMVEIATVPVISFFLPPINFIKTKVKQIKWTLKAIKERFKRAKEKILFLVRAVSNVFKKCIKQLQDYFFRLLKFIKMVLKKVYAVLRKVFNFFNMAAIAFFYIIRLMLAYSKVLLRYGLLRVRTIVLDALKLS